MRRILEQLTETPALVLGRRTDILAWNPMAAALFTDFARFPAHQRNYVRLLFLDPAVRQLQANWAAAARTAVAALRMEAASEPDDPRLAALVGELSVQDADFRTWWAGQLVTSASYGVGHRVPRGAAHSGLLGGRTNLRLRRVMVACACRGGLDVSRRLGPFSG
jgi:hypothetical protein